MPHVSLQKLLEQIMHDTGIHLHVSKSGQHDKRCYVWCYVSCACILPGTIQHNVCGRSTCFLTNAIISPDTSPCQKVGSSAGNESEGIVAMLSILPEVDVAMVENVGLHIDIVEALRGQHHPHITPGIKQGDHLGEEVDIGNLVSIEDADQLGRWDGNAFWVDLGKAVVQIARLAVHLTRLAFAAGDIDEVGTHLTCPAAAMMSNQQRIISKLLIRFHFEGSAQQHEHAQKQGRLDKQGWTCRMGCQLTSHSCRRKSSRKGASNLA